MEFLFPLMLLLAGVVVLTAKAFGLAILWEIWNIRREKQRVQQIMLNHEQATKARKGGPLAQGVIWDRELDG